MLMECLMTAFWFCSAARCAHSLLEGSWHRMRLRLFAGGAYPAPQSACRLILAFAGCNLGVNPPDLGVLLHWVASGLHCAAWQLWQFYCSLHIDLERCLCVAAFCVARALRQVHNMHIVVVVVVIIVLVIRRLLLHVVCICGGWTQGPGLLLLIAASFLTMRACVIM
jgi:hypothetical protein